MKKILFIVVLMIAYINSNAQFTLEHTYDSAATWNTCSGNNNQLMIINFEVSGERYVKINRCGDLISIYDMNHSLIKNISLASFPHNFGGIVGPVLYISENLFNTDSKMEFMYISDSASFYTTKVYNENGTLLFSENGYPSIIVNVPLQQFPIYNTSLGTKMILSYENGQAKVFSLAGSLSTGIGTANQLLLNKSSLANPYPNPTQNITTVNYSLPEGIREGYIIFYDLNGNIIKRFKVDNTFNNLQISTSDIAAGEYYFALQCNGELSAGKKLIVIK